jgi:hypothetical protein
MATPSAISLDDGASIAIFTHLLGVIADDSDEEADDLGTALPATAARVDAVMGAMLQPLPDGGALSGDYATVRNLFIPEADTSSVHSHAAIVRLNRVSRVVSKMGVPALCAGFQQQGAASALDACCRAIMKTIEANSSLLAPVVTAAAGSASSGGTLSAPRSVADTPDPHGGFSTGRSSGELLSDARCREIFTDGYITEMAKLIVADDGRKVTAWFSNFDDGDRSSVLIDFRKLMIDLHLKPRRFGASFTEGDRGSLHGLAADCFAVLLRNVHRHRSLSNRICEKGGLTGA